MSEEEKGRYQRKKKLYEKGIIASYIEKKQQKNMEAFLQDIHSKGVV